MTKTPEKKLSQGLEAARSQLAAYLTVEAKSQALTMEDRLTIIDRLIKIEALEFKISGVKSGSAFDEPEGDE